ncbi:hypothetical protein Bhyg_12218 [Pseudolycoriella hygida]|uniref:Uncharacterized protein n=1 Tax=Pseudolycoriella hygida TaxID=35572 RepID=A0A9Q0MWY5_9DIPT|nr:hypothetical protein Bhyg_12218 [Pseudolycoriella hygida]
MSSMKVLGEIKLSINDGGGGYAN